MMHHITLVFRNIWFHRKPYLAVMAGVMISASVITGALIVGDSVRFSLRRLTDLRLGKTRYALEANDRFFRQDLANELSVQTHLTLSPVMQIAGIAINSDKNLRINQVQVIGVDKRFGELWDQPPPIPGMDEAIISRNVAEKLKLKQGDDLLLRIRNQGKAPSGAPFVAEKSPSVSMRVKVTEIATDEQMGRFSLKNNQSAPYNIFVSLKQMASLLKLSGYANILLVANEGSPEIITPTLDSALRICWKADDAGLVFRKPLSNGIYQITTDRIFFPDYTANAVLAVLPSCKPILTYLVNSISSGKGSTPYSFVTATSESFLKQPIGRRQVIINDWLAKDLGIGAGDSVMLRYFLMGPLRSLHEDSARFFVKSVIPVKNGLADPGLMPDFPGLSDAGNCRDWETGAPVDLKKIRVRDEQYWRDYRGTPKAFISIEAGKEIWGNRFGNYTAFRFDSRDGDIPGFEKLLMQRIKPDQYGLFFRPVYAEGQIAANNSTDFGELFLSLSFFILLSALLLTAMLFSMVARMRMAEKRHIMTILSGEALLVIVTGAIAGSVGGICYNYFLILGLNTIWQDAVNTSLLVMEVKVITLITGAVTGIITSLTVLLAILWKNLREPLSSLVKGSVRVKDKGHGKTQVFTLIVAATSIGISMAIWLWVLFGGKAMNSSLSLIAGGLMIPGGLALLDLFLKRRSKAPGNENPVDGIPGIGQLALKNLALHRSRTISVVALLALGTFTIIITGANRKTFFGNDTNRSSGTGGFLLWTASTLPMMNDLNTIHGASAFGLQDEDALKTVRFFQLPGLEGDDASCLNLNQVSNAGVLGIPANSFDSLHVFSFSGLDPKVDPSHP
ncbi:MAG: ABC transporter permease, partial [Bacteroidetes bacterium]|nr:ABC transporter permease [Bacteroidota bacterium]